MLLSILLKSYWNFPLRKSSETVSQLSILLKSYWNLISHCIVGYIRSLSILLKSYWNLCSLSKFLTKEETFNSSKVLLERAGRRGIWLKLSFNSSKVLLELSELNIVNRRPIRYLAFNSSKVLLERCH